MDLGLKGKRVLVTGATGGIGAAIAWQFAEEGASVVVHGRNADAVRGLGAALVAAGRAASAVTGDLADDGGASSVAASAIAAFGGIDVLVNNAGYYDQSPWQAVDPAAWLDMFNGNVVSMVRLIRRLAPAMVTAGWGRLIQVASVVATQPTAFEPHYCAAKAAVVSLSQSLAKELAGTGVTANTISPGPVMTKTFEAAWWQRAIERGWNPNWQEIERRIATEVLPNAAKRVGRVEEVAALVAFVASGHAGYINGADLAVDGGTAVGIV